MLLRIILVCLLMSGIDPCLGMAQPSPTTSTRSTPASWTLPLLQQDLSQASVRQATFTETHHSRFLKKPLVTHGRLIFEMPTTIEKFIYEPFRERYRVEGDSLLIENRPQGVHRNVSIHDYPPLQAFVEGMRGILTGDWELLRQYYTLKLLGSRDDWKLSLLPREELLAEKIDSIRVSGRRGNITTIAIWETNGDHSEMIIKIEDR